MVWDHTATIITQDSVLAPLSRKTMQKLTILYPDQGGYTPGDAYDYFYGKDFLIKEWAFRKSNASIPNLINTFESYKEFSGITLATEFKNEGQGFRLYFTDIEVITK